MIISDYCVYFLLIPVTFQIILPLVMLSLWSLAGALKRVGNAFSRQNALVAQTT